MAPNLSRTAGATRVADRFHRDHELGIAAATTHSFEN
jgi:hypothetical protein